MADYVWWFLILGIVIGGAIVAVVAMDFSRRAEDVGSEELDAEATLLAAQLRAEGRSVDGAIVADVLRADRAYRRLPPPDRFDLVEADDGDDRGGAAGAPSAARRDADDETDEVGHGRGSRADEDLTHA